MDRFEAMTMFVAVTEQGSFSAAARVLNVSLPTLSRRISDLEIVLGARLIIRTTRKLTLTDTGEVYLSAARRILDQVNEAEQEAAGEFSIPKGELIVTAPIMFGRLHLLPLVTKFLAAFPEINIRLFLSDSSLDLIDQHIDMALRIGNLTDSSMIATQVGSIRTVTCASPSLLAKFGIPTCPSELSGWPAVVLNTAAKPEVSWRFYEVGSTVPVDTVICPRLTVTTSEAAVLAAEHDVGVTRSLHYQVADALDRGTLRIILGKFEGKPLPVHLVHASRGQMALKLRRFLDFAAPVLRARLAEIAEKNGVSE
jgi:DNA-binding transcriptional LysR family regulator